MKETLARIIKPPKKKTSKIKEETERLGFIEPFKNPQISRVLVCIFLSGIISVLVTPQLVAPRYSYRPGDISKHTIRAPEDYSVEDTEATEARRHNAMEAVRSVYDFNSRLEWEIGQRISTAFSAMRDGLKKAPQENGNPESRKSEFEKLLRTQVDPADFSVLEGRKFKKEIEDYLIELTGPFAQSEIVPAKDQLFKERGRGIALRDIYTKEEIIVDDFASITDLNEARILLKREARRVLKNVRIDVRRAVTHLSLSLAEPTITLNTLETSSRRQAAKTEVSPLYYNLKKGEVILREGVKISTAALVKLQGLALLKDKRNNLWTLLGFFMLSFMTLYVLYRFATQKIIGPAISKISYRDVLFLCAVLLLTFLSIKVFLFFAKGFSKGFTAIPLDSYLFAVPYTFAAIVVSVVLSPQIAALSAIIISIFACFLLDRRFAFFVYSFLSALVASQEVCQSRERKTIIRAGLIVGGVNALIIISLYLISGDMLKTELPLSIGFGVLGGVLSAVLATGIVPIVEMAFNYTTDIKLLELADLNQPVLRKLLISAPGTYHHSILVGILAEAAAEAINANPLMARVSAYYHDIGKISKPQYFVENQRDTENKHDKLSPSMSSLIITAHVKDGMELARKNRLGKPIVDIISQHHGTSCINYFFQKAKDRQESAGQPISDKDFRYPGPKPQTKEAGIVMLADAVQATSKTLSEPTPARIQGMVQRIINNIFVDGQLDECELTLKDLHLMAENFNRILNGIFHSRIDYPEQTEKESNGKDLDKKPPKADPDRPPPDSTDGERDLGSRIGITKSRGKHSAAGG